VLNTRTDAELVMLARGGDKDAFGCLVERYGPMAKRAALRMIGQEDIAQELCQEALLQAYLSLRHLRSDHQFRSWLYGIVLNVCRDYLRSQKMNFLSWESLVGGAALEAMHIAGDDPQEIVEQRELHRSLYAAVNDLSSENKAATQMFYFDGLSIQEIAAKLGVSIAAIKGRLHRSRNQLRARLSEQPSRRIEGEKHMIKVTIADIHRYKKEGQEHEHHIIYLHDESQQRVLPIWIGPAEGSALAFRLRRIETPRPTTFDFMATLLDTTGAKLIEARVEALKDRVFFGIAKIQMGATVHEIDARPSDVLTLAAGTECPIYVSESIPADTWFSLLEAPDKVFQAGRGLDVFEVEMKCPPEQPKKAESGKTEEEKLREYRDFHKTLIFAEK
jgi:RNA polymerase sigma factor (sigma-70 family)